MKSASTPCKMCHDWHEKWCDVHPSSKLPTNPGFGLGQRSGQSPTQEACCHLLKHAACRHTPNCGFSWVSKNNCPWAVERRKPLWNADHSNVGDGSPMWQASYVGSWWSWLQSTPLHLQSLIPLQLSWRLLRMNYCLNRMKQHPWCPLEPPCHHDCKGACCLCDDGLVNAVALR